jgi:hypothetical protein
MTHMLIVLIFALKGDAENTTALGRWLIYQGIRCDI